MHSLRSLSLLSCGLVISACSPGDSFDESGGGGKADSFANDQLVVNEIAAHPNVDVNGDGKIGTGDEYIEIVNGGSSDIDLSNVEIADGHTTRFEFPLGTVLPAHEAVLVMADSANFVAPEGALVFSAGRLGLNNDTDSVTVRVNGVAVEKHGYNMPTSERRSWNRAIDGDHGMIFHLADGTPGVRQDGTRFGGSILSVAQADKVMLELDDDCPDSFCGGDFNFYFRGEAASLSCLGDGNCTMTLRAGLPTIDDKFPRDVLAGLAPFAMVTSDPGGTFVGRVTGSVIEDTFDHDQDVFVNLSCVLEGDYFQASDIIDGNGDVTDAFEDNIIDCLTGDNGLESGVLSNLPTYRGLLTEFEQDNLLAALHDECPDTFCGGDFTYFFLEDDGGLRCTNDGDCALDFTVTPFDDRWIDDPTSALSADELTSSAADGSFDVTATGSKLVNNETVVEMRCDMFASNVFEPGDIYNRDTDEATDEFRELFLSCLSDDLGAEATVLTALPLQ